MKIQYMSDLHLNFIKQSLSESTAKHIVVVTHHLPTFEVVAPHHKCSVLNSTFATVLRGLIADSRIDAWIYGHSHTNIDSEENGTKVVCNQRVINELKSISGMTVSVSLSCTRKPI